VWRFDTLGAYWYPEEELEAVSPTDEETILAGLRLMAPKVYEEAMALLRNPLDL